MPNITIKRRRFPPEFIRRAVWLYAQACQIKLSEDSGIPKGDAAYARVSTKDQDWHLSWMCLRRPDARRSLPRRHRAPNATDPNSLPYWNSCAKTTPLSCGSWTASPHHRNSRRPGEAQGRETPTSEIQISIATSVLTWPISVRTLYNHLQAQNSYPRYRTLPYYNKVGFQDFQSPQVRHPK